LKVKRMNSRRWQIISGFALPQLLGMLLMTLTGLLLRGVPGRQAEIVFSVFVIIPLLMGMLSAYCWRKLGATLSHYYLWSLYNTILAIVVSGFWMREGVICLIIVSPLLFTFILGGALGARGMFERPNGLNAWVVPVLLAVWIVDTRTPHHHSATVTDTLVVRAPASEIWKHVLEVPQLPPSRHWLFRLGMPSPAYTKVEEAEVGGRRLCVFEGDLVLDERITVLKPDKELAFDIVGQPAHPEILGHLTLTSGRIVLQENGDGTTTMTGTSSYQLHVYPAWYYQLWSDELCREVHRSVMGHLKTLAEAPR
jgi:hypothetical protein